MTMHSEEPDSDLEARVRTLADTLERARFAGASPRVEVPDDASPDDVAARTIVAERLGLSLVVGGRVHSLHDAPAWDALWAAQAALRTWSFGSAEARLDRAAALAEDPGLQQRLGIWKLLVVLVRRLVRTDPEEVLRGEPARAVLEALDAADRVPNVERVHCLREVERLMQVDGVARSDADSVERVLWYVVRGRLALSAEEPVAALTWCVRLARLQAEALPTEGYLAEQIDAARQFVLLSLGELDEETAAAAREMTKGLQSWDVYRALVACLGPALGVDLERESARYTIAAYRHADD